MTGWDGNALLAAVLLALGIAAPVPDVSGGMMLALGCCYAVRAFRHVETRRSLGLSLFVAVLSAMIVAGLKERTAGLLVWGGLPLQIQMAAAGLFSQSIFELIASRDRHVLGKLADKVGLKGGDR